MTLKINIEFKIKDTVYIVADAEQNKCHITGILILPGDLIMYRVCDAAGEDDYYDFQLSADKGIF